MNQVGSHYSLWRTLFNQLLPNRGQYCPNLTLPSLHHWDKFLELFPCVKWIPKQQFRGMLSITDQSVGLTVVFWTIRFEAEHNYFKCLFEIPSLAKKYKLLITYSLHFTEVIPTPSERCKSNINAFKCLACWCFFGGVRALCIFLLLKHLRLLDVMKTIFHFSWRLQVT